MLARVPRVGQKQRARNKQTQQAQTQSYSFELAVFIVVARCLRVCVARARRKALGASGLPLRFTLSEGRLFSLCNNRREIFGALKFECCSLCSR
jgi:hypothetical protein